MTKNVLVTGCAGFIGFNLSKTLIKENNNVYGIDSLNNAYDKKFKDLRLQNLELENNFQFISNDLSDEDSLNDLADIDIVYHMGARAGVRQSFNDPLSYIKDNTIATTNVANFCKNNDISKMILASTSSIYGNSGEKEMVEDIDEKINPPSIYASTKLSGETLARTILSSHNTNLIITRFFTVYGPYGRPDMSILRFIHWIMENKEVKIFGDGEQRRSFTYIDDVVDLLLKVQDCDSNETFNVGNNKTSSLNEVIKIIEHFSNKKAQVVNEPRAFRDPDVVLPSLSKSKNILKWEPKTNIEDGIKATIEWYSSFQDKIKDFTYIN
jgi:nucleoside-diphosphate-sugar epimerase